MYRGRKYKKTSIFNPALPTNYLPTYNQRKGMVIQKAMTPPSPRKVISHKDIEEAVILLTKSHRLPSRLSFTGHFTVPIDPNESAVITLDDEHVLSYIQQEHRIPIDSIYYVAIDNFYVKNSDSSGPYPSVSYQWVFGDTTCDVTTTSASSSMVYPYIISFPTPYIWPLGTSAAIQLPRLNKNSSSPTQSFTSYYNHSSQTAISDEHSVYDACHNGKEAFFWYEYSKDKPISCHSTFTVDNSTSSQTDISAIIDFIVIYNSKI